ncbi:MAG TPA: hypothetical protein VF221_19365 [Chloroflexota bacterium]
MHELVEQFCTAWEAWDERSGGGDLYLDTVMRYLGGSVPSGDMDRYESNATDPSRLSLLQPVDPEKSYTVDDMRTSLDFLVSRVGVNAGFLISSLMRIVGSDLEQTAEAYRKRVEALPASSDVQRLFEHYSGKGTLPVNAEGALGNMAGYLQERLSALPGRGGRQFPIDAWRQIMIPLLDTDIMYTELHGEFDEDEL